MSNCSINNNPNKSHKQVLKAKRIMCITDLSNKVINNPHDTERDAKRAKLSNKSESLGKTTDRFRQNLEPTSEQIGFPIFAQKKCLNRQLACGATLHHSLWCTDIDAVDATLLSKQPLHYLDESGSPAMVSTYAIELYDNFNIQESEDRVDPLYIKRQPFVTVERRAKLVNVMVRLCSDAMSVNVSTLFLGVRILDQYLSLSKERVKHTVLLQTGVAAIMMAAKFEEGSRARFPNFCDLANSVDDRVTRASFAALELHIARTIDWAVHTPTVYTFLKRYLRAGQIAGHSRASATARCICERSLLEYSMLKYLPSLVAATAVNMARAVCGLAPWTSTLEHHTGYCQEDLRPCVAELRAAFSLETTARAVEYARKLLSGRQEGSDPLAGTYSSLLQILNMPALEGTTRSVSPPPVPPATGTAPTTSSATSIPPSPPLLQTVESYRAIVPLILERYVEPSTAAVRGDDDEDEDRDCEKENIVQQASVVGAGARTVVSPQTNVSLLGDQKSPPLFRNSSSSSSGKENTVSLCSPSQQQQQHDWSPSPQPGHQQSLVSSLSTEGRTRLDTLLSGDKRRKTASPDLPLPLPLLPGVYDAVRSSYGAEVYAGLVTCPPGDGASSK